MTRENAVSAERLASIGITAESWAKEVEDGMLPGWIATDRDRIVGYCFGNAKTGEVVVLALLPTHERKGLGRELFALVTEHLRVPRPMSSAFPAGWPDYLLVRSANGRPPGPVWRYAIHCRQPGPGVLPLLPA